MQKAALDRIAKENDSPQAKMAKAIEEKFCLPKKKKKGKL